MTDGFNKFTAEAERISEYYSGLTLSAGQDSMPEVSGSLNLVDETECVLDTYLIRIVPTINYPNEFPLVYETGGRLPKNTDWHIYQLKGNCCIKNIPEEMLICNRCITLASFIRDEVTPYFFNQKFREDHGYFLHERAHGAEGNLAFFEEQFKTTDLDKILTCLAFIKRRVEPSRTNKCFCGRETKYRKCHREAYREVSKFTDEQLKLLSNWLRSMRGPY